MGGVGSGRNQRTCCICLGRFKTRLVLTVEGVFKWGDKSPRPSRAVVCCRPWVLVMPQAKMRCC